MVSWLLRARPSCLQVITTVLAHFTRGMPPLTVTADAKVPGKHWSKGGTVERKRRGKKLTLTFPESNEGQMVVHKGELVSGILDKAVFGKFGLVHAVQVCEPLPAVCLTVFSLLVTPQHIRPVFQAALPVAIAV